MLLQIAGEAAMGALTALFRLFRRSPPPLPLGFAAAGLEIHDSDELAGPIPRAERAPKRSAGIAAGAERLDDDLFGVSFTIEYADATGNETRRRITIHDIYLSPDGSTYLRCWCHERGAARTFRLDRVRCVIDADGVVHEPLLFFRDELAVQVAAPVIVDTPVKKREAALQRPKRPETPPEVLRPGMAQRRVARDGLRVLAALSRSDGAMHEREIAVILEYISGCCGRAGLDIGDADLSALAGYVKRQYPTMEILHQCLARVDAMERPEQVALVDAAAALISADGREDSEEVALLAEIRGALHATA